MSATSHYTGDQRLPLKIWHPTSVTLSRATFPLLLPRTEQGLRVHILLKMMPDLDYNESSSELAALNFRADVYLAKSKGTLLWEMIDAVIN